MAERFVWVNGEFIPESEASVSVFDHGILYGDGLFEGIKAWDGKVFKLVEHIDRFYDCAKFLGIKLTQTPKEMQEIVLNSVAMNGLHQGVCYIRLVATRGKGDLGINPRKCREHPTVYCIAASIQLHPEELYQKGLRCIICATRRNSVQSLPGSVKSLNYINNILGVMEANRAGADEGIMLNLDGYVVEGTAENLFFAKHGVIHTPELSTGALAGITRASIIEIAKRKNYEVREGLYTVFDLYTADEVWMTGTGADLIPVVDIQDREVGNGKPGPIFVDLRSAWMDYVNEPEHHSVVPSRESVIAGG
ncbi:branched-chain-amino-acid transaminase [bacterium]|nr:branched-chain-amino-acid transaminase [bacterium]